jgi:acylpyruvate hydrolase
MRLATIRNTDGSTQAGRIVADTVELLPYPTVREVLEAGDLHVRPTSTSELDQVVFAPLIPSPEKIICVGLNYRDHAAEAGRDIPDYPVLFAKYSRSLIGAQDPIRMPPPGVSDQLDWEVELAVVIGRPLYHGNKDEAGAAIAGYATANDVSLRDWQRRTGQFLQGKTFEQTTPLGPQLVTPDEVDHARSLRISCELDGERVQDGNTSGMIFTPTQVAAYISQFITLVPGDVLLTGTPAGVGAWRKPVMYMRVGQTLVTEVEGLGRCSNKVVAGPSL